MRKRRLGAPSPALVISLIALFVALGGTTYAATNLPKNSVGTEQLKKNAVTSPKIKNGAVTATKINTNGLTVPSALHAKSADSATNATQASDATDASALGGQPPSAYAASGRSILKSGVAADSQNHVLATLDGLDAEYTCYPSSSGSLTAIGLATHLNADSGFASGDFSSDGGPAESLQQATDFGIEGTSVNLDVVAWAASVGKLIRVDLGATDNGSTCNIWGLMIPAS